MNKEKTVHNSDENNRLVWVFGIVSVIFVIGAWIFTLLTLLEKTESARGTFGDMFGGVNALFSGLAFAGIIITILLQSKELSLQRSELKATTAELERTADAQEKTEKALTAQLTMMKTQQFEASFFNLLKNHKEIIVDPNSEHLTEFTFDTKNELSSYFASIQNKKFYGDGATKLSPSLIYSAHILYQNICKSILHIAEYIENNDLQNKPFYHQTLFYSLLDDEKFIIGMVIKNELELTFNFSFDYTKYYMDNCQYKNSSISGYFPPIKIYTFKFFTELYYPNIVINDIHKVLFDKSGFSIEAGEEKKPNLISIAYKVLEPNKTSWINGTIIVNHDTKDLANMFLDRNLQTYLRSNGEAHLELEFKFSYCDNEYDIAYPAKYLRYELLDESKMQHIHQAYSIATQYGVKEVVRISVLEQMTFGT